MDRKSDILLAFGRYLPNPKKKMTSDKLRKISERCKQLNDQLDGRKDDKR